MPCQGPGVSPARKMLLLASMYFCQAVPMGYVFGSLPVIMREDGVSLARIGLLFALHLPWAFKFLFASRVDRHCIPALGRRRSWIFPTQWVACGLLLAAAHTPPGTAFGAMFAIMLAVNTVMAVGDIAVDGYATDMLEERERAWGNSVQAGARYVGMFLGAGLLLALHRSLGWQAMCMLLAGVVFLLSLPVFLHREIPPVDRRAREGREPAIGARAFLRRRDVRLLLPVLIAPTAFAFSGFQMRTALFVDLGLDSATLGRLTMCCAVPLGVAGTLATAWLLNRFGTRAFLRLFGLGSILLAACSAGLALAGAASLWQAGLILSVDNILVGGANVWAFTLMMRASVGRNSGTGFAVLSSLFILFPLAVSPLVGRLGDLYGFAFLYSLLGVCVVAGLGVAEAALRAASRASRPGAGSPGAAGAECRAGAK